MMWRLLTLTAALVSCVEATNGFAQVWPAQPAVDGQASQPDEPGAAAGQAIAPVVDIREQVLQPDESGAVAGQAIAPVVDIRGWRKLYGVCEARFSSRPRLSGGSLYRSAPFTVYEAPTRREPARANAPYAAAWFLGDAVQKVGYDTAAMEIAWHFSMHLAHRYLVPALLSAESHPYPSPKVAVIEFSKVHPRDWGCILYDDMESARTNLLKRSGTLRRNGGGSFDHHLYGPGVPVPFPPGCQGVANTDDLVIGTHCGFTY